MKTIEAVIVGYRLSWQKWPDTDDTNFDSVLALRDTRNYKFGDEPVLLNLRYYPVHTAYVKGGVLATPTPHPYINNTVPPPPSVLDAMIKDLKDIANDGVKLCIWEHVYQCYPYVAQHLKDTFAYSLFVHGDDCPGSTEIKTEPVAKFFDCVIHCNVIWKIDGELTSTLYEKLGVKDRYYVTLGLTGGLPAGIKARLGSAEINIDDRIKQLRAGDYKYHVSFIGGLIGHQRPKLNDPAATKLLNTAGLRSRFLGIGMRDGLLEPRNPAALGAPVADVYLDSFAVLNSQFIGLMGTRPYDAWATGSLLVQCDPTNELSSLGILPGIHYAHFDGSIQGLISTLQYYLSHMDEAEAIIRAGHQIGKELQKKHSMVAAYQDIITRNADKWGW